MKKKETFEEGLARLESIIESLEDRNTGLDRALSAFEEGLRLSRALRERLDEASGKIEILSKDLAGRPVSSPLDLGGPGKAGEDDGDV